MRNTFLFAVFFLGIFLTNFAAHAGLGNSPAVSNLISGCHARHVVAPTYLSMDLRMVNFNKCYQWGIKSISSYDYELIRDLLAQDFENSTNQEDKDALRKAISELKSDAPRPRTAEAQSSGTAS